VNKAESKIETIVRIGLIVAAIILLATIFITFQASKSLFEVSVNLQKSNIGLLKLEEIFSNLSDAESGVRGYVITGREAYLEPYNNAIQTINEEIGGVRKLISGNPSQMAKISEIESLASQRLALLKESRELRTKYGFEEAQKLALTGKGRIVMGYLRDAINEIQADEYEILNSRLEHQRKIFRNSISLNAFAIIFAFIFAGLTYFSINRDLSERRKAEETLERSLIQLAKKSQYERIVSAIIQNIHASGNLREVLENAAESMSKNIDRANFCSFYIIEGEEAILQANRGHTTQYLEQASRIPYPKGITWKTIIEGHPIYVPDVNKDDFFGPAGREMGIKSHLSVPIKYAGFNVGCVSIGAFEKDQFGEDEFALLEVIANQIEIAINRVKQEDLLRQSEERYRTLFDQSPVGVYIFDKEFKITHCNERFAQILQTSRDKIIGINMQELRDKCVLPLMEQVFQGHAESYEGFYQSTTGSAKLWVSIRLSPLRDDTGNVISGMAVVEDITERKRGEEIIRESEERFRNMADTAPVLVWVSGTDKLCTYFNSGWLKFTGRTMEQNIGMGWTDSVHLDDLQYCLDTYSNAFEEKQDFEMEYRLRRYDGEYRWVLDHGVPRFLSSGVFAGYIGSCIDITDRRLATIQLEARERYQQALVELGQLALAGTTDLSTLMNEAVSLVAKNFGVEYAKILELQPDSSSFLLRAGVGWKEGSVGHCIINAGTESQAGYTLLNDETVIVNDMATENRFIAPPLLNDHSVVSGISTVIHGKERPYGVLGAHSASKRAYTSDETHFLQSVANTISEAIERVLVEEELRITNRILEAVNESSELNEVFTMAIDRVMELTGIDIVGIYLVEESTNEAVLEAHRGYPNTYVKRAGRIPYPRGVTWNVINTGEVHIVQDVSTDPHVGPAGKESGFQSMLSVPVKIQHRAIGAIHFHSDKKNKFGQREIHLFTSIGTQIALAVSKAKQAKDLKLINEDLSSLNLIATSVHKSLDLKEVLNVALDKVVRITPFDIVFIYLVDEKTKEAVLHASRGLTEDYIKKAARIAYPMGVTWNFINEGEFKYIDDIQNDPNLGPAGRELGHHTEVVVPIKQEDKTKGIVVFGSRRVLTLSSRDLNLVNAIGNQIAIAIVQASLYEKSQAQSQELRDLYEDLDEKSRDLEILNVITQVLHKTFDLDEVYKIALDLVIELENVDMAIIYLVDENTSEAVVQAHRNFPEHYLERASKIPYPKGITWRAINSGSIINIEDAQKDPQIGSAGKELGHHSLLGIPILQNGAGIGVIWFLSYKERKFDEREVNLLLTIGNQIATAIIKAKLYRDLQDANEKLMELDKMKDEFISMASHELRTPLTAINGFISMLLEGDYGSLPPEAVEALLDMNTAAKRLIGLTNYMLDISRIEQGRLEFKTFDFDIGELCEKVINDLTPIAQGKGLTIEYQKPTVEGTLLVSGDKFRVEQVIINLIDNALKYTESGRVAITHRDTDRLLTTDVIDTGIGVPQDDQKLLFQKFRAVHHSLSEQYKGGTGMGLYICKLFLTEMKGDIWLEKSELGQGSTFSFSLPRAKTRLN
jgi:PAS domain S-box-containing protein